MKFDGELIIEAGKYHIIKLIVGDLVFTSPKMSIFECSKAVSDLVENEKWSDDT